MKNLHVGDKVHYQPEHYGESEWENGIVKEVREDVNDAVWVVYNCAEMWISTEITPAQKQIYAT